MFMQENNKVYGFVLSLYEYSRTIPTLWDTVRGKQASYRGTLIGSLIFFNRIYRFHHVECKIRGP
jgi:hypothetical protein